MFNRADLGYKLSTTTTGDDMTYTLTDDCGCRTYTCAGFRAMLGRLWGMAADGADIKILDNSRAF